MLDFIWKLIAGLICSAILGAILAGVFDEAVLLGLTNLGLADFNPTKTLTFAFFTFYVLTIGITWAIRQFRATGP